MTGKTESDRVERVLAREIVQKGVTREAGETVILKPHQAEAFEAEGYLEPQSGKGRKGAGT